MKVKSIVFNSTCLLSPNSLKDRELLNSWWTRTGTSTPEGSPKIQPILTNMPLHAPLNAPRWA